MKKRKKKILLYFFLALLILGLILTINKIRLTGKVVEGENEYFEENVNLFFTENAEFNWTPIENGEITSIKIYGGYEEGGELEILFENLSIYKVEKKGTTLTGQVIEGNKTLSESKIVLFFKRIFGGLTGKVTDKAPSESPSEDKAIKEEKKEPSSEEKKSETPKEEKETKTEKPSSETKTEIQKEETTTETTLEEPSEEIPSEITPSTEENILPENPLTETTPEKIIEESTTNETISPSEENISITPETKENETVLPNETKSNLTEIPVEETPTGEISKTQPTINETKLIENITTSKNETEIEEEIILLTNETKIIFENECIETCNFLQEKKDFYNIKIILKNTNLTIKKIVYSLKTNQTIEIPLMENITEETFHSAAKLGEPVNWTKKINTSQEGKIILELPKIAKNINVIIVNETENVTINESENLIIKEARFTISGKVISEEKSRKKLFSSLTGKVITETSENIELIIDENATQFEIKYETDAPTSKEENLPNGKKIEINGPEEVHYENILAFTELNESLKIKNPSKINIFWLENNSNIKEFHLIDKNNNSIYDYIEWIVPNLSSQTFEIIVITKAEHLNESRKFIIDIYEEVKELDDVWSPIIKQNEFVRVNFEKELTSKNDITIYPKIISGNPKVEIYKINENKKIAEFSNIISDKYNKVYLTNLENETSTFDLKIIDGELEFDHIIDPINYSSRTCSGIWGFDCGVGPPESGDNTFDICSTGTGNDESVEQIYINATTISPNETIKINCEFDLYTSNDDTFIWYYNGTSWRKLYEHKNWGSSTITNESISFIPDNVLGTHWVRCGIIYTTNSDSDECMNTGSYYDNDDINFTVENPNNFPSTPTNITCDNGNCNMTINNGTTIKSSGSIDAENNSLTYFIEAILKNQTIFLNVSQNFLTISQIPKNISAKNCLGQWGFDCGTGPAETGGDNTFDSCNNGNGADESVENIYLNSTKIYYGDTLSVTCTFDPYRSSDDTYIWYYNGTSWRKLYEHINWGSNKLVNESATFKPDNYVGVHWIRCGISYYTDTDYCQDTTRYFDNDDISFEIVEQYGNKEKNTSKKYYSNLGNSESNLEKIELTFEIDSYNPTYSNLNGNLFPDLFLEVYNGATFSQIGNLNLSSKYTSQNLDTTNRNITKIIEDVNIINAWKNKSNQNISLTGIYFDSSDEINFTNIWINFTYLNWTTIGNHTENSNFYWNTTYLPEQNCINLRSKSIDFSGSNTFSQYFYKNSCLNISHTYIENFPPEIQKIYVEEMTDVSGGLNEGPLSTPISIKFLVYDKNGYSDLKDLSAKITFSKTNEENRETFCSRIIEESTGNYANYSCNILMWWYDAPGTWNIFAKINDSNNNIGENNSNYFSVGATSGFTSSPNFISWNELFPGAINQEALEPITLNNTGNVPKNIEINSSNLYGQIDDSKIIYANNFSVGDSLGCNGTIMEKNNFVIISGSNLPKGNYTLSDGTGQKKLYFCLKKAGEDLTSQNYTTSKGPWTIRIF